jgi:hypothetical protein
VSQNIENKKRGKLLTFWLVLMLITNAGAALTYLIWNSSIIATYPNVSSWIWYIYGLLGLANVVFTLFLFMWKKWAFFAFCGTTALAFVLNLIVGLGIIAAIFGLIGPVILYLLIRSKWGLLE